MLLKLNGSRASFRIVILLVTTFLGFSLSGCKDEEVAPKVLPQFNQYFPGTMMFDVDKRFLWIQTHIDGISASAADLMFKQDCAQSIPAIQKASFGLIKKIPLALSVAGKQALIVGFNHFWVVWVVRNGVDYQGIPVHYQVMNGQQFRSWLNTVLGFVPTPDQIKVVSLELVQQTPKGQPLQAPTLAQIRQQKNQQPQEDSQNLGFDTP
jgi:hypothetical protein